jgi:hypothetical protein
VKREHHVTLRGLEGCEALLSSLAEGRTTASDAIPAAKSISLP